MTESVAALRRVPNVLVVAPTGGGKTVIASEFVRERASIFPQFAAPRVLFFCHREELIWQTRAKFRDAGIRDIGIVSAKIANPSPSSPVQIASIQTVVARCLGKKNTPLPPADVLIPDEAHHYRADEWGAAVALYPNAVVVGLTATPCRSDGRALGRSAGGFFDALVVAAQPRELIEDGFLVPFDVARPGEKQAARSIAQDPVALHQQLAKGRRTIQFCASKREAFQNRDRFLSLGVRAATITADTPSRERKDILQGLHDGLVEVVTNVNVLTEGFDCPPVEIVQISRPCESAQQYVQMIGRGARISPLTNKAKALLIDQRGVSWLPGFGHPDADRIYDLDGEGMRLALPPSTERDCQACGGRYERGPGIVCPWCGAAPSPRPAPGDMIVTNARIECTGSIRRDPERIAHYWKLRKSAAKSGRDRRWCATEFRARFGHYPEQTWWDWYDQIRESRRWSSLPQEARDAAVLMAEAPQLSLGVA